MDAAWLCALLVSGCSSSSVGPDAMSPTADGGADGGIIDGPGHTSGTPGLGAHALVFSRLGNDTPHPMPISTPPMATQASGSTIVVSVGRGDISLFTPPTDSMGNRPYVQIDTTHPYGETYPNSGTATYAFTGAAGGAGFRVSAATNDVDEITLAAVEIIEGTRIQDSVWNLAPSGSTVTSRKVTTTGPATLVAFWWGDHNQYFDKTAVPNNGFTVIDSVLVEGSLVQCAVAVKNVAAAGTYDVTWTATPVQGAQLWLIAVQ